MVAYQRHSQGARVPPPPYNKKKIWCSKNAPICNKIDALEGSIEIASATAYFYLEIDVSLYPQGCFPNM